IQGDMDQSSRIAEFDRFKSGDVTVLVASDVAARGLDVKGVSHVINFDVPWQPDDYIHRIGRTGRAGMTGIAYTLATSADGEAVANIEKLTGMKLPRVGAGDTSPVAVAEPEQAVEAEAPRRERARPAPKPAAKREERKPEPRREERKPEPRREERKPEPRAAAPKPAPQPVAGVEDDDSWNGPMPSFLSVGFSPSSD
ncbi:MAG: helicase-related protein, partial [Sphingomicrobium sp.]